MHSVKISPAINLCPMLPFFSAPLGFHAWKSLGIRRSLKGLSCKYEKLSPTEGAFGLLTEGIRFPLGMWSCLVPCPKICLVNLRVRHTEESPDDVRPVNSHQARPPVALWLNKSFHIIRRQIHLELIWNAGGFFFFFFLNWSGFLNLYQQLSVQKTLYNSLLIYCLNKMV